MTHYIVLRKQGDGNRWAILGDAEASGPEQARKKVDEADGEYLVVPIRNATFIIGKTVQPEPRPTSTEVPAQMYLDTQETLPAEPKTEDEPEPLVAA